jgi:EmrB/QacA subfamily drug resistance transporter
MKTIPHKWKVFLVVAIGIFMGTLDGSILNIANPTIAASLGITVSGVQWIVTAYLLVVTSSLLLLGQLGDRYGNGRVFMLGFFLFTGGSFLCSLASGLVFLVTGRMIQALGAAMLMATGVGMVSLAFPANERGRALGLTGSIVGVGNVAGPALGGLIVTHLPWSFIFLINIPIGIIGLILGHKFLPTAKPPTAPRGDMDFPGILLFSLLIVSALMSVNRLFSPWLPLLPALSLLALIIREARHADSFLDKALLKTATFTLGNILLFIAYFAQMAALFLTPFFIENVLQLDPARSGLLMVMNPLALIVVAPLAGTLADKLGGKKIVVVAFAILSFTFFLAAQFSLGTTIPLVIAVMLLLGVGMGCFSSPNNSEILGGMPMEKQGYGGGFIATIRNMAFAFGTAVAGSMYTAAFTRYSVTESYREAASAATTHVFFLLGVWLLLGLVLAAGDLFFQRRRGKKLAENRKNF